MNSCDDVSVNYVFQPMVNSFGKIVAVECLSRITLRNTSVSINPLAFFKSATFEMKKDFFHEQIDLIKYNASWFLDNNIIATINIDQSILTYLLKEGMEIITHPYKFIHFEITENVTFLYESAHSLNSANNEFIFWLDDFGAGYANYSSIFNHHFKYIKIDKAMFWSLFKKPNGKKLLTTMLCFFKKNGFNVIVEGVENISYKNFIDSVPYFALQGYLWPECGIDTLMQYQFLDHRNVLSDI